MRPARNGRSSSRGRVVHVAPAPVLAGLGRLHHRVLGLVEVSRRVAPRRGVAAAEVAAAEALPQGHPRRTLAQTVTTLRVFDGLDGGRRLEVIAGVPGTTP